jgi:hypothetical protein
LRNHPVASYGRGMVKLPNNWRWEELIIALVGAVMIGMVFASSFR